MGNLYRKKGRTIWMMKYYRDGVPIYESSQTDSYETALKTLKSREGAIADGKPVPAKANRLTLKQAFENVKDDYLSNKKASYDELERRIRLHLLPFFGSRVKRIAQIATPLVREYTKHRLQQGASHGEINRELSHLKRAFNLAIEDGLLFHAPHIPMLDESDNVRTGFFERRDLNAVVAHLPDDLKNIARFAYITGWRVDSEVLPMEWRRVDFDERLTPAQQLAGTVWLEVGTAPDGSRHRTKNKRGRVFTFTSELRELLVEQQRKRDALKEEGRICPWVFHRSWKKVKGKRITSWLKAWTKACRAAGLPGRLPHDFRRTAVRNLVRAGVPERVAMQMTGHKTRSVFERYNIVSDGDLATAAAKLDEVGGERRGGLTDQRGGADARK